MGDVKDITIYVSIGNSDDKLSQADWAQYCRSVTAVIYGLASHIHGEWYSLPNEPFQNAAICFVIREDWTPAVKESLKERRKRYKQDSIAWAVVQDTEFI